MTVASVIKFRSLASQLTDAETQAFIDKLAVTHSEFIIDSLSTYFIHQSTTNNVAELDADSRNAKCIEFVSKIIQSRVTDDVAQEPIKLDSLPRRLIGVCGSFLAQSSYASLSRCNRSTYLGCSTPKVLRDVHVDYEVGSGHPNLDLSKFPFANKLSLWIRGNDGNVPLHRQHWIVEQVARMSRLQCLDLRRFPLSFLRLLTNQQAICDRVRSLAVSAASASLTLIVAFKNIEYLKLYHIKNVSHSDVDAVANAFTKLKGLDIEEYWNNTNDGNVHF